VGPSFFKHHYDVVECGGQFSLLPIMFALLGLAQNSRQIGNYQNTHMMSANTLALAPENMTGSLQSMDRW
jgi:hypothetical protein